MCDARSVQAGQKREEGLENTQGGQDREEEEEAEAARAIEQMVICFDQVRKIVDRKILE